MPAVHTMGRLGGYSLARAFCGGDEGFCFADCQNRMTGRDRAITTYDLRGCSAAPIR
jgi:hypothetical protein